MSKMPAKKKSCFQITSVTQAQVAAIGATDDTESLEDPDESRTEDVSSEIYDLPRAEYDPGCDRSSSEETLNNVGEPEAMAASNSPPQPGQASALSSNPGGEFRKVAVSGSTQGVTAGLPLVAQPGAMQQQSSPAASIGPVTLSQAAPPPAASTVSCTSRFRVIKLDHGIGEPFRRGRWTCTEFYEKDSEGSAVGRTVDGMRHAGVTLESAPDRDSGLGHTGGSAIAPSTHSGQGSVADVSLSSPRMHSVETPPQQQIQHPNYSARLQGVSGSTPGSVQPPAPQSVLPGGQNGLPQPSVQTQKSPVMPPSAQPGAYHPVGHHPTTQPDYYQQLQPPPVQPGLATGQSLPLSSLPAGSQPSRGTSVPSQLGDGGAGGGSVSTGQHGLSQQQTVVMGGVGASSLAAAPPLQQQAVNQYAAAGQPQLHGVLPTSSGVQNVPAVAAGPSAPAAVPAAVPSASSAASPNVTTSSLPPRSRTAAGLGAQGLPAAGFGHTEGGGGKSEDLISTQSPLVPVKEEANPFMPESLQLTAPTVNSLFGIHIPVDGDVDRNPSKAFYRAFQSGTRLRDAKPHSDRASGANAAAIDNKIEQAMDLVKSHLMYAVREEVEVLKEQIKELYERNSVLERENAVLKSLANNEQLSQLPAQAAPQPPHPQLQLHPKPQQLQNQLDPGQQQLQPNVTSA
ncbi:TSC22 domain family protein 2-like [Brachionichthys hirsutus]|uniref:TSC22 domain family protein 2-like n=1 Tax=Brachionichthys hirsutus TaxID=412623 RepID=UPI003604E187